ncbi:SNF2 family N-terminal domain-containing protein [Rhodocollybia butyracea]|uniref:SNF2 family N-terminal domain-containing protein n=1 Tax=Rhodocollybia butyracea TaxID=206335 RepID=A0A9P5UEX4_9AGAR|nr:SNF2 family N-terminal domain-containing protein [Rhodocollybia butyracea]
MPPRTRRSVRNETPSTTTSANTANVSPIFSANASAVEDSPLTSDAEQVKVTKTVTTTRSQSQKGSKRAAPSDDEDTAESRPAPKRRATANRAFVEVKKVTNKGKGKETVTKTVEKRKGRAQRFVSDSEDDNKAIEKPRPTAKGKGKGPPAPVSDSDEESEGGLEYDENYSLVDSDGSSGSEFVASDEEEIPFAKAIRSSTAKKRAAVEDNSDADEDEDAIMLEAAVQLSLQTVRNTDTADSSSSSRAPAVNTPAAVRAAAIEKRLAANAKSGFHVDDSAMSLNDLSGLSDSDAEPLTQKFKAKSKAKSKSKRDVKESKVMTMADIRRAKKEEKQEERALRKKLGRKLTWAEKSTIALHKHHPELKDVWGDLEAKIKIIEPAENQQPAGIKLTLLPFQRESLHWMKKQEEGPWKGGMLAVCSLMGKTIQVIALLVSDKKKPNLVIAPTVAVMQWRNEIEAHTDGMKVLVWHGASRESDIKELMKHDVILTTYSILESVFRKQESGFKRKNQIIKERSPLHNITWNRVILDEAHNIKDRASNTAKAAFELQAVSRWCLSGTPLQNRVGELYSLIRFLGGDPFAFYYCKRCDCKSLHWKFSNKKSCDECHHSPMQHTCFWNNEILTPIQKDGMDGPGKIAFKKLKILLDRMMLRRTKLQRADDLGLPPRIVIVRRDYFSPEEKELYRSLFTDAKRQFGTYLDQGTLLNNYSNIFTLLTRMRQMACHPDLVIRSKTNASKFTTEDVGEATVCRICNDIAEDAIQSKCRHIFDRECIKQYLNTAIEQTPSCPVCFIPLTIDLEAPALDLEENVSTARQGILGRLNLDTWRSSTKIEALVEETRLRKSIVFSQFVNFLDLIAYRLQKAGFTSRSMLMLCVVNNVDVTVFLVSLKAGGVALNLTEASRVYLMDSWWNPAEAMDRIHRLGQHRPVKAIKLVVEDSIESRIVQLQEKKSAMVDATLSPDDSAMGRLTPEDLQFLFRVSDYTVRCASEPHVFHSCR